MEILRVWASRGACVFALCAIFGIQSVQGAEECFTPEGIKEVMLKVNAFTRDNPYMETDRNWIRATYYTGVMGAYKATDDVSYLEQALAWGNKHQFKPGTEERPGGNILTSAQTWLELYFIKNDPAMIQPTIEWLDTPRINTPTGGKPWYLEGGTVKRYADSLYVGPPALAMLAKATGDQKYLDWMHQFYREVYDELYDEESGLLFRDKDYIYKRTANDKKVFWSRGNGWVFAGLPRILTWLPESDPEYDCYVGYYKRLAAAIAPLQNEDGFWRANLGDPDDYRMPESSGTAFFTYAFAWGINNGLLDRETYLSVVIRGWNGLHRCVLSTGKLGWVQPVDAQPRPSLATSTHEYAAGLFLLAGSEVLKLAESGGLTDSAVAANLPDNASLLPAKAGGTLTAADHPLADKINDFLSRQDTCSVESTGLKRADYLTVIVGQVKAMQQYQDDEGRIIDPVFKKEMYYSTPCYAHSVAALAARGGQIDQSLLESGMKALDISLESLANRKAAQDHGDFYTWPAMLAYELFADFASDERKAAWAELLGQIDPATTYRHYRKPFEGREGNAIKTHWPFYNSFNKDFSHNWHVVHSAGEFLRHQHGYADIDYVDFCLGMQLPHFTNLGMYSEDGQPLAYDLFARHYFVGMLQKGYRSSLFHTYRDLLWRGAWTSLFMMSPNGELPTGYRSSQHIWNEAQEAMVFEVYAAQYARAGRLQEAGAFKRAAHLALQSVKEWIRPDGSGFIVKNRYPIDTRVGHEVYSMHTCYNMLACSILAQAWQFAEEGIAETPCPADVGGFVLHIPEFHKIFANAGGTYIEYDTKGDHVFDHHEYNPTGLIRVHLKGGHPQLGPSDGCAVGGSYIKPGSGMNLAVGPAWKDGQGNWTKLADMINLSPTVETLNETPDLAKVRVTYAIPEGPSVSQEIVVMPDKVCVEDRADGAGVEQLRVYYPMLVFDGAEHTQINMSRDTLDMQLDGKRTRFKIMNSLEAELKRSGEKVEHHRNGIIEPVYFDVPGSSAKYSLSVPDQ